MVPLTIGLAFLGAWEIILIVIVVLLLFGAKKIPELMHSLGKGVKNFKEGMNEITDSEEEASEMHEEKRFND